MYNLVDKCVEKCIDLIRGVSRWDAKRLFSCVDAFYLKSVDCMTVNQVLRNVSDGSLERKFVPVIEDLAVFLEKCLEMQDTSSVSHARRREYINELAAAQHTSADFVVSQIGLFKEKLDKISVLFDELSKMGFDINRSSIKFDRRRSEKFLLKEAEKPIAELLIVFPLRTKINNEMTKLIVDFWAYLPKSSKLSIQVAAYELYDTKQDRDKFFLDVTSSFSSELLPDELSHLADDCKELISQMQLHKNSIECLVSSVLRLTGGEVPLKTAKDSFRQGWNDIIRGRVNPIETLWDGIDE